MFQRLYFYVFIYSVYYWMLDGCLMMNWLNNRLSRQPDHPLLSASLFFIPSLLYHPHYSSASTCTLHLQNRTHRRVWYHSHPKHPPPRQWRPTGILEGRMRCYRLDRHRYYHLSSITVTPTLPPIMFSFPTTLTELLRPPSLPHYPTSPYPTPHHDFHRLLRRLFFLSRGERGGEAV
jgi:hypothetical protein